MRSPEELVAAFESCEIPLDQFHHREHLIVALWYARHRTRDEALLCMRTGLQKLLHANGKPPEAYSEPTTRFWMDSASEFVEGGRQEEPFAVSLRDFLTAASSLPRKR